MQCRDPLSSQDCRRSWIFAQTTSTLLHYGWPISIKFVRLVQNNMPNTTVWPQWKPEVEFQCRERCFFKSEVDNADVIWFADRLWLSQESNVTQSETGNRLRQFSRWQPRKRNTNHRRDLYLLKYPVLVLLEYLITHLIEYWSSKLLDSRWDITTSGLDKKTSAILKLFTRFRSACYYESACRIAPKWVASGE